eukprot:NODE_1315_length_1195_cov_28.387435_g1082_i0.p2 GENE.NODE_1315_length_1195_cov_28.387435_g1082_i0~~NODE_1315_length_1195_cov_28.387435_g1082_i0.p2  ORF type:complete len:131 (-),score=39.49 NODE_1315_length_1195_cov_28.387435_g1082_i0:413-805(-)
MPPDGPPPATLTDAEPQGSAEARVCGQCAARTRDSEHVCCLECSGLLLCSDCCRHHKDHALLISVGPPDSARLRWASQIELYTERLPASLPTRPQMDAASAAVRAERCEVREMEACDLHESVTASPTILQ